MASISERLTELMSRRGESLRSLEDKTGILYSTIGRYSSGETKKIPASAIESLARALNTNPVYLLGLTDDDSIDLSKKSTHATTSEGTWNKIASDPQKLAIAQWIADMDEASLTKVAQILALMLDKEIPSSDQR